MSVTIQCPSCRYYLYDLKCLAFPDGIPDDILTGEFDHTVPHDGDNGIQYEKISKESTLSEHLMGQHDQKSHGRRDWSETPSSGEKAVKDLDSGGFCDAIRIDFNNGESGIWKEMTPPAGGAHSGHSEVAAYKLSELLGLGVVPPTVYYNHKGKMGTLQKFIKNGRTGQDDGVANEEDGRKIVMLDVIIGNGDRHNGNFVVDSTGKTWAIDHGHAKWYHGTDVDDTYLRGQFAYGARKRSLNVKGDKTTGDGRIVRKSFDIGAVRERWKRITQDQFMDALKDVDIDQTRVKKRQAWASFQYLIKEGIVSWEDVR